ncbi:MAG: hypothetical protein JWL69_4821 [Phycisphaerales bacterium]|nr:hypothetical protein [Phycisphaerales bacterium]
MPPKIHPRFPRCRRARFDDAKARGIVRGKRAGRLSPAVAPPVAFAVGAAFRCESGRKPAVGRRPARFPLAAWASGAAAQTLIGAVKHRGGRRGPRTGGREGRASFCLCSGTLPHSSRKQQGGDLRGQGTRPRPAPDRRSSLWWQRASVPCAHITARKGGATCHVGKIHLGVLSRGVSTSAGLGCDAGAPGGGSGESGRASRPIERSNCK